MNQDGIMPLNTSTENRFQYNGKELEKDGGIDLSDYGARWYDASIGRFTGVDPLVEKYSFQSPYAYATNNPVLFRDILGMGVETEIFNEKGKKVGEDENGNDGNVVIVSNKVGRKLRKGKISFDEASAAGFATTKTILRESINVIDRTLANGGREQGAIVSKDGKVTEVSVLSGNTRDIDFPNVEGEGNTSIHSHPTGYTLLQDGTVFSSSALDPGPGDVARPGYSSHVIVGRLGLTRAHVDERNRGSGSRRSISQPGLGAAFYPRNFGKPKFIIGLSIMKQILE